LQERQRHGDPTAQTSHVARARLHPPPTPARGRGIPALRCDVHQPVPLLALATASDRQAALDRAPSVSDPSQTTRRRSRSSAPRWATGPASFCRGCPQRGATSGGRMRMCRQTRRREYGFQTEAPSQPGVSRASSLRRPKGSRAGGRFIEVYEQDVLERGSGTYCGQQELQLATSDHARCSVAVRSRSPAHHRARRWHGDTITVNSTCTDELDYNEGRPPTVPATAAIDVYLGSSTSP